MATRFSSWDSSLSWQCCLIWRGPMRALQFTFVSEWKRRCCFSRARWTRSRIGAEASPARVLEISRCSTARDFDVEIDAIEERPGDALAVRLDLDGTAAAFAFQIASWPDRRIARIIQIHDQERVILFLERLKNPRQGSDRIGLVPFALEQNAQRFQHIALVVRDQDSAHQLTMNRVSIVLSITAR